MVIRYHPEGNFLAHLRVVTGTRFGESIGDTGILEILYVEHLNLELRFLNLTFGFSILYTDDDDGTFALAVADAVTEHASKSREDWRLELVNDDDQT